jgi:FkbM family methyltransferase
MWQKVKLGIEGPMKIVGQWYLPAADNYFGPLLERTPEGFEIDHLECALTFVEKFDVAMDVGAHIGTWTVRLARDFKQVYAFEPAPDTYECLSKNCESYANISLSQSAIGAYGGYGRLDNDPTRQGNTGARILRGIKGEGSVKVSTLDSFGLKVLDFLKIDVEGYEIGVLQGGVQTLRRCRPVVLLECKEFVPPRYGGVMAAVKFLGALGFTKVGGIRNDWVFRHQRLE